MKETIMWDNYVRVPRPLCVSRICNQPRRKRKNEVIDHFSLEDEESKK